MQPSDWNQRLVKALEAERKRVHGRAGELDAKLGKGTGYLGRIFSGRIKLQVETLFEALHHLEVEPEDFFAKVLRHPPRLHPADMLVDVAGNGRCPAALKRLDVLARDAPFPSAPDGFEPPGLAAEIDELEELRHDQPNRIAKRSEVAVRQAVRLLQKAPHADHAELVAKALAVHAMVCRLLNRFPLSARYLISALRLSEAHRMPAVEAYALRSTAALLADCGEAEKAEQVVRRQIDLLLRLGDLAGAGGALLAQAFYQLRQEHYEEAISTYEAGLRLVPESETRVRCAALQNLGTIHLHLDQLEEAAHFARLAASVSHAGSKAGLHVRWLVADIDIRRERFAEAEVVLREIRERWVELENPLNAAIVSLRLAQVLLQVGKLNEVRHLADEMLRLLTPLRKNKVAAAVIADFTRAAMASELTVDLVEAGYKRLKVAKR